MQKQHVNTTDPCVCSWFSQLITGYKFKLHTELIPFCQDHEVDGSCYLQPAVSNTLPAPDRNTVVLVSEFQCFFLVCSRRQRYMGPSTLFSKLLSQNTMCSSKGTRTHNFLLPALMLKYKVWKEPPLLLIPEGKITGALGLGCLLVLT